MMTSYTYADQRPTLQCKAGTSDPAHTLEHRQGAHSSIASVSLHSLRRVLSTPGVPNRWRGAHRDLDHRRCAPVHERDVPPLDAVLLRERLPAGCPLIRRRHVGANCLRIHSVQQHSLHSSSGARPWSRFQTVAETHRCFLRPLKQGHCRRYTHTRLKTDTCRTHAERWLKALAAGHGSLLSCSPARTAPLQLLVS